MHGTAGVSPPGWDWHISSKMERNCSEAPSEALIMLDPKGSAGHPHGAKSLGTLAKQQLQVMVSVALAGKLLPCTHLQTLWIPCNWFPWVCAHKAFAGGHRPFALSHCWVA